MRRTVIAVAAALVIVGSAGAARKPSAAEQKAIRQAFTGFVNMPSSPSAKDNRIVSLAVSTLDPRYAAARLTSRSAGLLFRSKP